MRPIFGLVMLALLLAAALSGCGTSAGLRPDLVFTGDLRAKEAELQGEVAARPADVDARLRLGALLLQADRPDEARSQVQRALAVAPDHPDALHLLGLIALEQEHPRDAVQHLLAARQLDPTLAPRVAPDLRRALRAATDDALAEEAWQEAAGYAEELAVLGAPDGHVDRARLGAAFAGAARVEYAGGYFRDALATLERARGYSDDPELHFLRGAVLVQVGNVDASEAAYRAYAEAVPAGERGAAWRRVARQHEADFQFDAAERAFAEAVAADPGIEGIDLERALLALKVRDFDKADAAFRAHLAGLEGQARLDASLDVSRQLLKFGAREMAVRYLEEAASDHPGSLVPVNALARLDIDDRRPEDIEKLYTRWLDANPGPDARVLAADAARGVGLNRFALRLYGEALAQAPSRTEIFLSRAELHHALGEVDPRDAAYADYVAASADRAEAHEVVGARYLAHGDSKRATAELEAALALDPSREAAAFQLARIDFGAASPGRAAKRLDAWIDANPDDCGARLRVAREFASELPVARRQGHLERAATCPDPAVSAEAHRLLGRLHVFSDDPDYARAEEALRGYLAAAPDRDEALEEIAEISDGRRQLLPLRADVLSQRVALHPDDASGWVALAELELEMGRPEKAIEPLVEFVNRSEDLGRALEQAVGLLLRKGAGAQLLAVVTQIDERGVEDPGLNRSLGEVFSREGPGQDLARARSHFQSYLGATRDSAADLRAFGQVMFDRQLMDLAVDAWERAGGASAGGGIAEKLGVAYAKLRRPLDAERAFAAHIQAERASASAHAVVGRYWMEEGYLARARAELESAFGKAGRSQRQELFQSLVDVHTRLGLVDALPALADRFVDKMPGRPEALTVAAEAMNQRGLYADAVRFWRAYALERPGSEEVEAAAARALIEMGDVRAGADALREVAARRGFAPQGVLALIELLVARGLDAEALDLLTEVVDRGQADAMIHLQRAAVLLRMGELDRARADLERAVALARDVNSVLDEARDLCSRARRLDWMVDLVQRAIGAEPDRADLHLRLVDLALEREREDEAELAARRFLQMNDRGAAELARVYAEHERIDRALELYRAALLQPQIYDERGELIGAVTAILRATGGAAELDAVVARYLAVTSDAKLAVRYVAVAYLLAGRKEDGLRYLLEAERDKSDPKIRLYIAEVLSALGRHDEARSWFELYVGSPDGSGQEGSGSEEQAARVLAVATTLRVHGQVADAERLLERFAASSDDGAYTAELVRLYAERGETRRALDALGAFLESGRSIDAGMLSAAGHALGARGLSLEFATLIRRGLATRFSLDTALVALRTALRAGEESSVQELDGAIRARIVPGETEAAFALARNYLEEGALDRAEPLLREVVHARQPATWAEATRALMKVSLLRGSPDGARRVYREVLGSTEDRMGALDMLQAVALDLQLWDVAEEALREMARLLPALSEPRTRLADVLLSSGRDEALPALIREIVEASPNRMGAMAGLVEGLRRNFRYDAAVDLIEEWLERDKANGDLLELAARLSLEAFDPARARVHFDALAALHADPVVARTEAATAFLGVAELEPASALLDAVPEDRRGWKYALGRARLALEAGDRDEVMAWVVRAADARPNSGPRVLARSSHLIFDTPRMSVELARELAQTALDRQPDLPDALLVRAVAAVRGGDRRAAEADMERYVALGANLSEGHRKFAAAALEAGDIDLAREHLDALFGLFEDWPTLAQQAVDVVRDHLATHPEVRDGSQAEALRTLGMRYVDRLLSLDPRETWYITLASDVLESTGDAAGAIQAYREAMRFSPSDSTLFNNLAYLYARRAENLDEARALVRKAQALEPKHNVYYLDTEGWIAFQQGDYAEAVELIEGSIAQMTDAQGPSAAESFWHLGKAYLAVGRGADAALAFRRAARLDPLGQYGLLARKDLEALAE
jgi:tetratricopeptide (TPR) repeat protein